MSELLLGRRIVLGVSSSIAIYKAPEIVRLLQKQGALVRVVMSEESRRFLSPLVFEALTKANVLHRDSESWAEGNDHISLSQWAELYLIAPASANTINKAAAGIADNLLLTSFLAFSGMKMIAPAMNTKMLANPLTQESLEKLQGLGTEIIRSISKELACGDVGEGALQEPGEIVERVIRALHRSEFWQGRSVAVSGGGSIESIDSVRFISNRSSGKMSHALARTLYYLGADVTFIAPEALHQLPMGIRTIPVHSARSYQLALSSWQDSHTNEARMPFIYMVAAISDYESEAFKEGKLKKEQLGEVWSLTLRKTPDILRSLNKEGFKVIGFKLENAGEEAMKNAKNALYDKEIDAICLNLIGEHNPMGSDENELFFITREGAERFLHKSKRALAFDVIRASERL